LLPNRRSNGPYFKKKACAVTEDYADGAANSSNSSASCSSAAI